jgi:hypothetical protein
VANLKSAAIAERGNVLKGFGKDFIFSEIRLRVSPSLSLFNGGFFLKPAGRQDPGGALKSDFRRAVVNLAAARIIVFSILGGIRH